MTDLYSSFGACGHQYIENLCTAFSSLDLLQKRVTAWCGFSANCVNINTWAIAPWAQLH